MSSTDRTGKFGPGAISAAEKAVGGGALPTPPPKPGALHASSLAAQSVTETLAATVPPTPAAPLSPLSDETVRAKIARAALRQFKRPFPEPGKITTPTGNASAYNVYEKNTQGQRIAYIHTSTDDFPGTAEPTDYVDIAAKITPTAAAAVLGSAPLSAEESIAARRAATTAKGLEMVSEQQRNGGGKHAKAGLRTIALEQLTPRRPMQARRPHLRRPIPCNITAMSFRARVRSRRASEKWWRTSRTVRMMNPSPRCRQPRRFADTV